MLAAGTSLLFLLYTLCKLAHSADPKQIAAQQIHIAIGDRSNERRIAWVTLKEPDNESRITYGFQKDSLNLTGIAKNVTFYTFGRPITVHWSALSNLKPSTQYYYSVGHANVWSKTNSFTTFPEGNDWPANVIVFGDLGTNRAASLPLLLSLSQHEYHAVVHAGDIAYDIFTRQGRIADAYFNNLEPLISKIVYMVAPGNHEYMPIVGDNGANFKHRFKMPNGNNDYYTFTCGPIRFVIISTELYYSMERKFGRTKKMVDWLQRVLTEANKNRHRHPWIVVVGHKPFYCSDSKPLRCKNGYAFVRQGFKRFGQYFGITPLERIFKEFAVDLVFSGHNHQYERTFPVYDLKVYNSTTSNPYFNPTAPIYVVTGAAGNQEGLDKFVSRPKPWSAQRISEHGFTKLTSVNATHLRMQQISSSTAKVIDEIWIIQQRNKAFKDLN